MPRPARNARLKLARSENTPEADAYRRRTREYQARKLAVSAKLRSVPCADCRGTFPTVCMDFDHRDPTQKDRRYPSPGQMLRRTSLEAFLVEIEKCDVVCSNCHRIRSAKRGGWSGAG